VVLPWARSHYTSSCGKFAQGQSLHKNARGQQPGLLECPAAVSAQLGAQHGRYSQHDAKVVRSTPFLNLSHLDECLAQLREV
jgi:hypothetical protein